MNCKPGDLAIVVANCDYTGMMVEILYAAPKCARFTLPDGFHHAPIESDEFFWVFKILGERIKAPTSYKRTRLARYASGQDAGLKPIRGAKPDEEVAAVRGKEADSLAKA